MATTLQQAGLDSVTLDNNTTANLILRLCVKSSYFIIPRGKDGSKGLCDEQPSLLEDGDLNLIIMMLEDIRQRN